MPILKLAAALALACAAAGAHAADPWPTKPVTLVIPFAAGGPGDAIGRLYGEQLSRIWGQPVLADNRAGAGGNLASEYAARSAPDGYTLLVPANSHVFNSALYPGLKYDPIKDFTPISMATYYSLVLVANPDLPIRSVSELVSYAKANPGKLAFGSAGTGTPTHLANELFREAANINIVHIPYKGAAPATTDLLGGHIQLMFNNPLSALPFIKSNKLRAIATTGLQRAPTTPEVPTVAESGYPGFEAGTWFAFLAPAGLPKELAAKISADVVAVSRMPDVRSKLLAQGIEPRSSTPEELGATMRADSEKWTKVIRAANIKPD